MNSDDTDGTPRKQNHGPLQGFLKTPLSGTPVVFVGHPSSVLVGDPGTASRGSMSVPRHDFLARLREFWLGDGIPERPALVGTRVVLVGDPGTGFLACARRFGSCGEPDDAAGSGRSVRLEPSPSFFSSQEPASRAFWAEAAPPSSGGAGVPPSPP